MKIEEEEKHIKNHVPFVARLCINFEQTEKYWCEFCGEQIKSGYKLFRNGKGDTVFVCDKCLKCAK